MKIETLNIKKYKMNSNICCTLYIADERTRKNFCSRLRNSGLLGRLAKVFEDEEAVINIARFQINTSYSFNVAIIVFDEDNIDSALRKICESMEK